MIPSNPDLADKIAEAIFAAKAHATTSGRQFMRSEVAPIIRAMLPTKAARVVAPASADAERIYQLYPRKVAPIDAKRAIMEVLKTYPAEQLIAKTQEYAHAVSMWPAHIRRNKDGVDTVPHPSTWFRRGSYSEDSREWYKGRATAPARVEDQIPEPAGWREEFPDFIDVQLPWEKIDKGSQKHISNTMSVAASLTEAVNADAYSTRLREA